MATSRPSPLPSPARGSTCDSKASELPPPASGRDPRWVGGLGRSLPTAKGADASPSVLCSWCDVPVDWDACRGRASFTATCTYEGQESSEVVSDQLEGQCNVT